MNIFLPVTIRGLCHHLSSKHIASNLKGSGHQPHPSLLLFHALLFLLSLRRDRRDLVNQGFRECPDAHLNKPMNKPEEINVNLVNKNYSQGIFFINGVEFVTCVWVEETKAGKQENNTAMNSWVFIVDVSGENERKTRKIPVRYKLQTTVPGNLNFGRLSCSNHRTKIGDQTPHPMAQYA